MQTADTLFCLENNDKFTTDATVSVIYDQIYICGTWTCRGMAVLT